MIVKVNCNIDDLKKNPPCVNFATLNMRYSMHNKNSVTLHIDLIKRTLIFTRDHKLFGIIIKEQTLGIRVLCNK